MESDKKIYSQGLPLVTREKIKQMGREETGLTNNSFTQSKVQRRAEPVCTNAVTLMEEVARFYRWKLDGVSAETALSLSKQSFGRIFNAMCQVTRFINILTEKYCSALSFGCISREW